MVMFTRTYNRGDIAGDVMVLSECSHRVIPWNYGAHEGGELWYGRALLRCSEIISRTKHSPQWAWWHPENHEEK